ncbi:MAG: hypothetical protein P8R54_14605 [Myxococcota bacterium]|nr:hypothetical protein [Myxococcota bacterium]
MIESGADWQPIGAVWISDGDKSDQATLEYRVWLEPAHGDAVAAEE